jgi:hypothetical protein
MEPYEPFNVSGNALLLNLKLETTEKWCCHIMPTDVLPLVDSGRASLSLVLAVELIRQIVSICRPPRTIEIWLPRSHPARVDANPFP